MSAIVRIAILANAIKAKAELKSTADAADRMAGQFKRAGSVLGTSLAVGAGAGAAGLGLLAKTGISTAAEMENANIAFTTMLGSADKAQSFIKDLSNFAAKTPFDFPGLQKSASSLISIGIDTKKVIPIMTTLGNVTSGMGTGSEGIKRATTALQQMNAAQKIGAQDLWQLRDAGIPVFDLLSAAMGKSKQEISDLVQNGQLGKDALDALMGALETGKGLERFSGLMEKQSQSLNGLWSTVKDTFSMGLAKALEPAIPKIKDVLKSVGDALPGIMAGIVSFLAVAVPIVSSAFMTAKGYVVDFSTVAWPLLKAALLGSIPIIQGVWTLLTSPAFQSIAAGVLVIVTAWKAYQTYLLIISSVTKAYTAIQAALNVVMALNPIGLIIVAIIALVAMIVVAYKRSDTFRAIVDGLWGAIKKAASAMWDFITKAVQWVKDLPGKIGGAFKSAGNILKGAGKAIMDGLMNGLKEKWEDVKSFLGSVTDKIPDWKGPRERDKKLLTENGRLIMQGFQKGLESQYTAVRGSLGGFTDTLAQGASGALNAQLAAGVDTAAARKSRETQVSISFAPTGDRVMDAILDELRKRVRVSGGSVQAVLGR